MLAHHALDSATLPMVVHKRNYFIARSWRILNTVVTFLNEGTALEFIISYVQIQNGLEEEMPFFHFDYQTISFVHVESTQIFHNVGNTVDSWQRGSPPQYCTRMFTNVLEGSSSVSARFQWFQWNIAMECT